MTDYLYLLRNKTNDGICSDLISKNQMSLDFENRQQKIYCSRNMIVTVNKDFWSIAAAGQDGKNIINRIRNEKNGRHLNGNAKPVKF